jgi:hypothetical protein
MTALDEAWQAALAAEHEAVFGYGLLGPHLDAAADRTLAVGCSNAHEQLRDRTAAALAAAGLAPVQPAADYPQLYPVTDATTARRCALRIEDDCAAAWRYLYLAAASTRDSAGNRLRSAAQQGLNASAIRATRWRGGSTPFPGIG